MILSNKKKLLQKHSLSIQRLIRCLLFAKHLPNLTRKEKFVGKISSWLNQIDKDAFLPMIEQTFEQILKSMHTRVYAGWSSKEDQVTMIVLCLLILRCARMSRWTPNAGRFDILTENRCVCVCVHSLHLELSRWTNEEHPEKVWLALSLTFAVLRSTNKAKSGVALF